MDKLAKKITIQPAYENSNNIYGYIDIGFALVTSDIQTTIETFNRADLRGIAQKLAKDSTEFNLSHVGESILYVPGGVSTSKGQLPAHTNNFIEIMVDGSARMRILLINNNHEDPSTNMSLPMFILDLYKEVYAKIMGRLFPDKVAYAKKYESLTVLKQFQPVLLYDEAAIKLQPELRNKNNQLLNALQEHRKIFGVTTIVTNDRIPKTGLYTVDKHHLELWGQEYTAESVIDELFFSRYADLGLAPIQQVDEYS